MKAKYNSLTASHDQEKANITALVAKYDADKIAHEKDGKFITNDPGTRRGADFLYEPIVLWNAIHDWNGGNVNEGKKVMLVVG